MQNGEIETIPQPAVKNLRSKFEQLAIETSSTTQNGIKRPPSRNGNGSLLEPVSPRQRTSSGGSYSHEGPDETRQLRASSSSSDLRKRPPPPPPFRGPKATSPNPSPLLRPVPIPYSPAPAISVANAGHPRIPSISLVDAAKPAEGDNDDTPAATSISSLRSKFSNNDSKGHFSRASESHIAPYPKSYVPYKIRSQPDPPLITNEDPLIELSPRSSSSSLSSPDSELSQHSAPLPKANRRHPPPPRPPPRHRASALPYTPTTETPPPLPSRRNTAISPVPVDDNPPTLPPRLPNRAHVTAPAAPTIHSELPCPSPSTERRVLGASRLLPPPTRTIALGDKLPPARRAAPSDSSDDDSEDEDLKGTGVDMLPDSSQSSRRPPFMHEVHEGYNIYTKITVELYTGHVRMSGTHVVIGHSHKVRLYDLAVQDTPLWVLDSKEVGVKGVTITSLEFRPARERHDKGRYAWVGTKEGHILEVDIKSGQFTGAKLSAHLYGVLHLFRHGRSMVSIDEAGKVLVFTPDSEDEDIKLSHTQPRVVRITEKVDFAKLMGGMLWTASRTDKVGAKTPAKTPIIRVYDIFTPGCVGRTVLPTEHVGPVTSAAILPSDPERAYVGHEEGYITIWALNTEDRYPKCVEVMKVSMSDILCLEGVNNRLWAGSRSGTISAYDVVPRPWVVTNCWNPHPGMPVMKLQVDPLGLECTGRLCVLSVSRDEALRLWDGLLSYDWIDQELMKYEQSYSQFRDLTVLLVSWNCDAAKPDSLTGDPANINFLHDVLTSVDSPDIISFGFQEVIDLESRKMAAKNVLLTAATGGKKHEEGVLPGLSEKVTGAYRRWFDRLLLAVRLAMPPECPYTVVHTESLVGLFTCIFVKNTERVTLRDMAISTIKRGMGGRYGNKGGIVARFIIEDSSMCFINCHLGAGQNKVRTRNADIAGILEEKTMFPMSSESVPFVGGGDGSAVTDHEMVFINGDMNYRIDQRRDAIVASVRANEWESMLPHDQLLKEIKYNRGCRLRGFSEGPLTFPPTYKYDRRSDEYDSSEKRRSPAWCDRVLWRARVPSRVEQIHYRRYEANVSDHRPVSSAFKMTIKSVRHEIRQKYKSEVQVRWADEEQKRLAVLRAFYLVQRFNILKMPFNWNSVPPLVNILRMKKSTEESPQLERFERGIWKICMVKGAPSRRDVLQSWKDVVKAAPLLKRLFLEVFAMDPWLTLIFVSSRMWSALETAITLYLSGRLLKIIEDGLRKRRPNVASILKALLLRLVFHVASRISSRALDRVFPRLRALVDSHFKLYLLQARLRTDVPTSQETQPYVDASDAWTSFTSSIDFASLFVRAWSQFVVVATSSGAKTSRVFALICFVKPIIKTFNAESMWYRKPHIAYTENEPFKRMLALDNMSSEEYRSEVIGGDLANYIITQYKDALESLGELAAETSLSSYYHRPETLTSARDLVNQLLGFFPTIYSTLSAILDPQFSMSSIAIMQQTSESFERSMDYLTMNVRYFSDQCQTLKELYQAGEIKNQLKEGNVSYPRSEADKTEGMSFDIRDLSFSYPGSQSVKPALSDLSLTIKSGQLVVIVGANGSGKSTILKILTRIYDPTSPAESILVDGLPMSHYRMADLRKAMVMLTQDHTVFPLSLGENIGLGCVEHVSDDAKIAKAAELGGATPCLEKLEKGKDTVLTLLQNHHSVHVPYDDDHPLRIELEKLDKSIELSGGEKQRVVASRTFMRFESDALKFVAVDEPSSAMDPEAEATLFENLINHRRGKTMIFVTHRFGHLTKHANLIVCMKDGSVAEAGTHGELMAKNGEYAKLYNIQASAFVDASLESS